MQVRNFFITLDIYKAKANMYLRRTIHFLLHSPLVSAFVVFTVLTSFILYLDLSSIDGLVNRRLTDLRNLISESLLNAVEQQRNIYYSGAHIFFFSDSTTVIKELGVNNDNEPPMLDDYLMGYFDVSSFQKHDDPNNNLKQLLNQNDAIITSSKDPTLTLSRIFSYISEMDYLKKIKYVRGNPRDLFLPPNLHIAPDFWLYLIMTFDMSSVEEPPPLKFVSFVGIPKKFYKNMLSDVDTSGIEFTLQITTPFQESEYESYMYGDEEKKQRILDSRVHNHNSSNFFINTDLIFTASVSNMGVLKLSLFFP